MPLPDVIITLLFSGIKVFGLPVAETRLAIRKRVLMPGMPFLSSTRSQKWHFFRK